MFAHRDLKGKKVVVLSSGFEFRGVVVEMGSDALVLSSSMGVKEIPWDRVTKIEEDGAGLNLADKIFAPFPLDFEE